MVVAMSRLIWAAIPLDLQMRFGPSVIDVHGLTPDEAGAVLRAYLEPWESGLFPFEPDGVRRLLTASGGNARVFLQTAHEVFDAAVSEQARVDASVVDRVAATGFDPPPSSEQVASVVQRVLERRHLAYAADYEVASGHHVDYAVLSDTRPIAYIEITNAVFAAEEAQSALDTLGKIKAALDGQVPIVLIVMGYSSPEVNDRIERVARVVVAHDGRFGTSLESALDEVASGRGPEEFDAVFTELTALKDELVKLVEERADAEHVVSERLFETNAKLAESRRIDEFRLYKRLWSAERDRIVGEIRQRRASLLREDLDRLADRRWSVFRDRQHERRLVSGAAAGILFLIELIVLTTSQSLVILFGIVTFTATVLAINMLLTIQMDAEGARTRGLQTVEDLESFVRQRNARRTALDSRDPFRRYAASLRAPPLETLRVAETEPDPIIRRLLVSTAVGLAPELVETALEGRFDESTRSVVAERADVQTALRLAGDSPRLTLVAAVAAPDWKDRMSPALPGPLAEVFDSEDMERPSRQSHGFLSGICAM